MALPADTPRVDLVQAFNHPLRVFIFALFVSDKTRPMEPGQLLEDLTAWFPSAKRKQVAYHLAILKESHLITAAD